MSVCDKSNTAVLAGLALAQNRIDRAHDLLSEGDSLHLQRAADILVSSGQCEAMKFLINECKLDVNKHNLLHLALLAGQEDLAKLLIVSGANVNQCWQVDEEEDLNMTWHEYTEMRRRAYFVSYGRILHLSLNLSVNCSVDMMHFLLQSGADVNRSCGPQWHRGKPALHIAAATGNVEKIRLCIDHGADIDAKTCKNDTALSHACDNSSVGADCLQVLRENGANPNSTIFHHLTISPNISLKPIHCATEWEDIKKLKLLLQHGAQLEARTSDGHTALTLACDISVPADCVRILLENGAFSNVKTSNQQTPLTLARELDDEEKISLLKQYGASEEERTDSATTALLSACQIPGDIELVKLLLENNASPNLKNRKGETALHYAVDASDKQKLQMLVEHKSDVNSMDDTGVTPLMKACKEVSVSKECVQFLLENNALPNLTSIYGKTALHHAARVAEVQKVKMLVQYGGNVNATDIGNTTPLIEACFSNDNAECVRLLLQNNASPKVSDTCGYTALHRAACSGSKEAINLLVEYQADVNAMTNCGKTPLMLAFTNDRNDCVLCLLQNNASPNLADEMGSTVLHMAAERGDSQMMDLLVQYQADVNAIAQSGETPLLLACKHGAIDCVRFLLHHNALLNLTDKSGNTALHLAVVRNDREIADLLIQLQADVNAKSLNGESPLLLACKHGQIECAKSLLQNNALPNLTDNSGSTALHLAAERDDKKMADLLVQYQADVNAISENGETPLMLACAKGSAIDGCINFLLEKGASVNLTTKENKTVLHYAVDKGITSIIQKLIEHGAHLEARTSDGHTALTLACKVSVPADCFRILLENGAFPNVKTSNQQTPLTLARELDDEEKISLLKQYGAGEEERIDSATTAYASPNLVDESGNTALHLAVERNDREIVDLLIQLQEDVNATTKTGETPLMLACKYGQIECAKSLLQNNALPNLTDNDGSTALHLTAERDDKIMADLLVQYQADVNATSVNSKTPLMLACAKGSVKGEFVNFLLENGALVNLTTEENKTALHYAITKGTTSIIQKLIEHGAEIDPKSLLSIAARSKSSKLLELIKRLGLDINVVDSNGQNAIMLAASSHAVPSNISALQRLVNIGVSVNQKNNNGWTPLMATVHRRSFKMAKILLEAGADVHAVRRKGNKETTILDDLLGSKFNSDFVRHLIRNGTVNSLPTKYNALLHKMIMVDEQMIIVDLVTHGMGPTLCRVPIYIVRRHVRLSDPVSPLTVALKYRNIPVAQYLIDNTVLCPCDLNGRFYHSELRAQLNQDGKINKIDEFYAQPKSLFQLSFVTVSHAIGGVPGRLDRVNSLPLPQLLKDSLLFKTGDLPTDSTSRLPFISHKRYRGWTITE